MTAVLLATLVLAVPTADSAYLYRAELVRAAPGTLLQLIDHYRAGSGLAEGGDHPPFVMRHSQGDHWDLLLLYPMESYARYHAPGRAARRPAPPPDALVAWREEVFVNGPPLTEVSAALASGDFYHIEMFVALPGARQDLRREREMENTYLATLGRPQNLIFERVGGAAWDLFTVGVYRDIAHFAESGSIPPAQQEAAARTAGFTSADAIGPFLRTLIQSHHDTLARAVR